MTDTPSIQWFPGHMKKTERMIKKSLPLVDAVIEVVDARIVSSSRNPYLNTILESKPRIIAVNKSDLADKEINKKWKIALEKSVCPAVFTDCKSGNGVNSIVPTVKKVLADKINRNIERGMINKTIHVMIVGIPNVGKSALINKLAGQKKANVEDRPGVTRNKQWVRISGDCELLDIPGILSPKFEDSDVALKLAFTGAVKDDVIDTVSLAAKLLETLLPDYMDNIVKRFTIKIDDVNDGYQILKLIAEKRGYKLRGNELDTLRASIMVLDEFRGCKLGRISLEKPM
ncbi:MAG: ribosome biogenesis GTPase YlqF [Ruminococcus sp.]|jgi:ribosome biogenesis GTPase A|nr:ribosome biogenesis GTPase YlqF [Ruminococcus sp.]